VGEIELVRKDLERIDGELRSAMDTRYAEFERRLESLLRELDEDLTRPAAREVRALIDEYLTPDVARRILSRTSTLVGGSAALEPDATTGGIPLVLEQFEPRKHPKPSESISVPSARPAPPPPTGRRGWFLPGLRLRKRRHDLRLELPEGPTLEVAAQTTFVTVPVWYATDRDHRPGEPPPRRFGTDMSIVDDRTVMNYGTVDVSIPKTHEIGRLESPRWYLLEWQADPARHVVVQGVTELDEATWLRSIRNRVTGTETGTGADLEATDTSHDILIFIHGYRTTWEESARRAAQFAYDLHFEGLPMLYSWPSRGDLLSYTADESASAWSAPHFTAVLKRVLADSGARRVHIVAHSMGNRVSTEALKVLALEKPDFPTPVREVVFAAPDIDRHTFQEFVIAFNAAVADFEAPRMPRLTLYACGVDSALDLSRRVHRLNRAGDSRKGIVVALPMDTIEVARRVIRERSNDSIGHSYFCSNSVVMADLVGLVLNGQTPSERAGLARKTTRGGPYWRLIGATPTASNRWTLLTRTAVTSRTNEP
jgi:esterase/lipase superfamily enzyme